MKQNFTLIIFLFSLQSILSQNYTSVDTKVLEYPYFNNLKTLSIRINNDFETDTDKIRAAYTWIANNINYDIESYNKPAAIVDSISFFSEEDYERKLKTLLHQKTEDALVFKKTLCIGFSAMFVELCSHLKIEAKIIEGVTKIHVSEINSKRNIKNHAWNVVKINNEWKLLDITWSTGFTGSNTKSWVKSFNDFFFLSPPDQFLSSHFPENSKWQLLNNPITLDTFFSKPVFYASYFKSTLRINPIQSGTLKVNNTNNKIIIEFIKKGMKPQLYYTFLGDKYMKPLKLKRTKKNIYKATIDYKKAATSNKLTIYLKNDAILNFKVVSN